MRKDPFEILGIKRGSSEKEIKSAYRNLARKHHPDKNPNDPNATKKFEQIREAYEKALKPDPPQSQHQPHGFGFDTRFSDIFSSFFGENPYSSRVSDIPLDTEINVRISFLDSVKGTRAKIKYDRYVYGGSGYEIKQEEIVVSIPPGIKNGQSLRIKDQGNISLRFGPGNLYVRVLCPHESDEFRRQGNDIYSRLEVDYLTAALGGKVEINTIHGKKKITIPPLCNSDTPVSLKRQGVYCNGQMGNHYAVLNIVTPLQISKEEKKLLEKIKKVRDGKFSS